MRESPIIKRMRKYDEWLGNGIDPTYEGSIMEFIDNVPLTREMLIDLSDLDATMRGDMKLTELGERIRKGLWDLFIIDGSGYYLEIETNIQFITMNCSNDYRTEDKPRWTVGVSIYNSETPPDWNMDGFIINRKEIY